MMKGVAKQPHRRQHKRRAVRFERSKEAEPPPR
jgi:hypothetical protein